jgi:hypothetical protein
MEGPGTCDLTCEIEMLLQAGGGKLVASVSGTCCSRSSKGEAVEPSQPTDGEGVCRSGRLALFERS